MVRARAEGWTLTGVLVVVAVLGLLASIAIPVALRARRTGHDPAATDPVRAIRTIPKDYNGLVSRVPRVTGVPRVPRVPGGA
jgi:type II secretory pathway pseudopilin PulG